MIIWTPKGYKRVWISEAVPHCPPPPPQKWETLDLHTSASPASITIKASGCNLSYRCDDAGRTQAIALVESKMATARHGSLARQTNSEIKEHECRMQLCSLVVRCIIESRCFGPNGETDEVERLPAKGRAVDETHSAAHEKSSKHQAPSLNVRKGMRDAFELLELVVFSEWGAWFWSFL